MDCCWVLGCGEGVVDEAKIDDRLLPPHLSCSSKQWTAPILQGTKKSATLQKVKVGWVVALVGPVERRQRIRTYAAARI